MSRKRENRKGEFRTAVAKSASKGFEVAVKVESKPLQSNKVIDSTLPQKQIVKFRSLIDGRNGLDRYLGERSIVQKIANVVERANFSDSFFGYLLEVHYNPAEMKLRNPVNGVEGFIQDRSRLKSYFDKARENYSASAKR